MSWAERVGSKHSNGNLSKENIISFFEKKGNIATITNNPNELVILFPFMVNNFVTVIRYSIRKLNVNGVISDYVVSSSNIGKNKIEQIGIYRLDENIFINIENEHTMIRLGTIQESTITICESNIIVLVGKRTYKNFPKVGNNMINSFQFGKKLVKRTAIVNIILLLFSFDDNFYVFHCNTQVVSWFGFITVTPNRDINIIDEHSEQKMSFVQLYEMVRNNYVLVHKNNHVSTH